MDAEVIGTSPTLLAPGETNAVGRMLGLLNDEWTLLIVQRALLGATRYGEFMAQLPISNAVLTGRLRRMTADGMLEHVVYQRSPTRAEYRLTPRSRSLWPMLMAIWDWERTWGPEQDRSLPSAHHQDCGSVFSPALSCAACAAVTTDRDVRVHWGPSGTWQRSLPAGANRLRPGAGVRSGERGPFPQSMSLFGNRWSAAILMAAFLGATRFSEFEAQVAAAPGSITERLKTFRSNGVLTETEGYRLTDKGRAFFPALVTALQWAQKWYRAPEGDAVLVSHRPCGQRFTGVLACDRCSRPLTGSAISACPA